VLKVLIKYHRGQFVSILDLLRPNKVISNSCRLPTIVMVLDCRRLGPAYDCDGEELYVVNEDVGSDLGGGPPLPLTKVKGQILANGPEILGYAYIS
jgi:hypothetical protein